MSDLKTWVNTSERAAVLPKTKFMRVVEKDRNLQRGVLRRVEREEIGGCGTSFPTDLKESSCLRKTDGLDLHLTILHVCDQLVRLARMNAVKMRHCEMERKRRGINVFCCVLSPSRSSDGNGDFNAILTMILSVFYAGFDTWHTAMV